MTSRRDIATTPASELQQESRLADHKVWLPYSCIIFWIIRFRLIALPGRAGMFPLMLGGRVSQEPL